MADTDTPQARSGSPAEDRPLQPGDLPGIHRILIGTVIAVLAPLFGFLGGSMAGAEGGDTVQPLYFWLMGGIFVGGVGALIAVLGGVRLVRARRERRARQAGGGATTAMTGEGAAG
ncbi:hypothetical protein KZX45_11355 [Georgenia sp. EYE_87]|uniref:hypothetical protein n=1 Tax=Georgenia sp. EYE_87 TaxID=2853448 RepID=UPI002003B70B|nr:hypothetical protein [Georgenia sp. EYE_87]MCK6211140.1 hypothetical protein [Georgenia sp. EYE_87]